MANIDKYELDGLRVIGPNHTPDDPDPAVSGWVFDDQDDRPILEWDGKGWQVSYLAHSGDVEVELVGGSRDDVAGAISAARVRVLSGRLGEAELDADESA